MSESREADAERVEPRQVPFRVGGWLAEPAWNRIRRGAETLKLEPRVMRLLATLAAAPGQPLTRQQLLDTVWPEVLVNEEALSRAISQLRRALGDDPKAPRFVQTVHKGGYCLIAPVTDPGTGATLEPEPHKSSRRTRLLWFTPAILAIALAAFVYTVAVRPRPAEELRQLVPLTSDPGREIDPAVSRDGTRVAYLASSGSSYNLFVRGIADSAPVRLTTDHLTKGHPAWSPDGRKIAFIAAEGNKFGIYVVGSGGGAVVKLVDIPSWSFGLDWSPDGRTLAYSDAGPGETPRIALLDVASKAARPIAQSESSAADFKPVFSPDGTQLAFIRTDRLDHQRIAVADLRKDGNAHMLDVPWKELRGIDWAPDGESLIFSARSGRTFGLWQIASSRGAAPHRVPVQGGDLFNPSISSNGRIVVEDVEQERDIWRVDLGSGGAGAPLIRSTSDDYQPALSPASGQLAFVSMRSGTSEIWIHASGRERRLTSLGGPEISRLSWSHDGQRLAFLAEQHGSSAIYQAAVRGGRTDQLLLISRGQIPIGWSADQQRLFVIAPEAREWRIEELDLATRNSRRILAGPIVAATVAADGRSIFAIASREKKLLRIVPHRGIARQFRLAPSLGEVSTILHWGDAVYLVVDEPGTAVLHRLDLKTGTISRAGTLDYFGGGQLTLFPGAQSVAYTHARETANDLAWTRL